MQQFKLLEAEVEASNPAVHGMRPAVKDGSEDLSIDGRYRCSSSNNSLIGVSPEQEEQGKPKQLVHSAGNHSDKCLFLCAQVCGQMVDWLIDSGAEPNLLSIQVYEGLGESRPPLKPVETHLQAANGGRIEAHGQIVLDISIVGATFAVPVIVQI